METVNYLGKLRYEINGEQEAAAASVLNEALCVFNKRRNAYFQDELEAVLSSVRRDYSVSVNMVM